MTPQDNPPENDNPLAASDIGCYIPEALDEGLERAREDVSAPAVQNLLALADRALEDGPWSLVNKPDMPPTGSRHDYWSLSIYLWPNPDTEDGLPYVTRPKINPEVLKTDGARLMAMMRGVELCTTAWAVTGEERYAERAAMFLRTWFLEPDTRMHPNMLLAQWMPGRGGFRTAFPPRYVPGRGGREGAYVSFGGVIEALRFPSMLDTVGLLRGSEAWTDSDHAGLQAWFRQFLQWMLTHQHGLDERGCPNNHGSWYAAEIMAFALFCDRPELARRWAMQQMPERVLMQIEPGGSMPHEIGRHAGLGYTTMTLQSFVNMALLAERVGIDRWHYSTCDGRSLRGALDWSLPYLTGEEPWPWRQERRVDWFRAVPVLCAAARRYDDERYADALERIPQDDRMPHLPVLYPAP